MKKMLIALFLVPQVCFTMHPILSQAHDEYHEGEYEKSYQDYCRYAFYRASPVLEDHINCFIGMAACERKLSKDKVVRVKWEFIDSLIVGELDEEVSQKIKKGVEESLYITVHEEITH
jgi:hypothetical protein